MTRRASGLILCTFVVIIGCSDNFTEQIIQNEEEDISDIDDAEQHNDSFKSSPDQELETFSLNIWYIFTGGRHCHVLFVFAQFCAF